MPVPAKPNAPSAAERSWDFSSEVGSAHGDHKASNEATREPLRLKYDTLSVTACDYPGISGLGSALVSKFGDSSSAPGAKIECGRSNSCNPLTSAGGQLASVGDFVAGDRANLGSLHGRDGGRVPVECREFDLKRRAVLVDVNHGTDVANLQTLLGNWRRQDDAVVLSDHADVSLIPGIGRHQSRCFRASIYDPDGSDDPTVPHLSLHRQSPVDNIFLAVGGLDVFENVPILSHGAQGAHQPLRILDRKTKGLEEQGFPTVIRVRRVQKVVNNLGSFNDSEMRV